MNIAFSKVLKISSERNLEFNFRKLPSDYRYYHVDVTNEKGERIIFSIYKGSDEVWRATGNKLPLWISAIESLLGEVIEVEDTVVSRPK